MNQVAQTKKTKQAEKNKNKASNGLIFYSSKEKYGIHKKLTKSHKNSTIYIV